MADVTALAILADDLTGALDAAAPSAARGAVTKAAATPAALDRIGRPAPTVLSVSTTTRHLPATAAFELVSSTCRTLRRFAPRRWFKKTDSTLRGNAAVEIIAAMSATGLPRALVCPAVPTQGRTVVNGVVHVDGVPLPETDFVRDTVSPASPLPIAEQIKAADPGLTVVAGGASGTDATAERSVRVADARDSADLARIARAVTDHDGALLMVGAAGLAEALADQLFGPPPRGEIVDAPPSAVVYVVGSRAEAAARQVQRLLEDRPDCVTIEAPGGRFDGGEAAALMRGRALALIHIPEHPYARDAQEVARALGAGVARLIASGGVGTLLLTGGDTAAAVLAAIDTPTLTVAGEIASGVPLSHVAVNGKRLLLVTKAGGFGSDDLLRDVSRLLADGAGCARPPGCG